MIDDHLSDICLKYLDKSTFMKNPWKFPILTSTNYCQHLMALYLSLVVINKQTKNSYTRGFLLQNTKLYKMKIDVYQISQTYQTICKKYQIYQIRQKYDILRFRYIWYFLGFIWYVWDIWYLSIWIWKYLNIWW